MPEPEVATSKQGCGHEYVESQTLWAWIAKREQAKSDAHGAKTEIGWGHQIRSYVLAPYQMIKDLRTNIETNQSDKVLNGDIDMFLEGALAYKLGKETI